MQNGSMRDGLLNESPFFGLDRARHLVTHGLRITT
jgi:hypothetical protein